MHEIVSCRVLAGYCLELTFSDGLSGRVDIEPLLWGPMFEPLREPALFAQVAVDPLFGAIGWPNGADVSPEYLREAIAQPVA